MKPEQWSRLEELFHAASALDGAERDSFLREECPDEGMRRELIALLAAGTGGVHAFSHVVEGAAAELAEQLEPAREGELIGPYRIVRRIGEGGMAVVYLAEQEAPVARRVALKILKVGLDTREVLGRFDAERRLLSRLVHPAIARILDAGSTPSGRPYFVLELVEGEPITDYCDTQRLSLRARIELIIQVCRAIHHAHQKGIVHRDLKPSNILVGTQDGAPVPKVIDFGIAKVIEQEATREQLRTQTRHGTLLGTWEYMSPEQAAGSDDLDTRTDVYSLGVILYELLAGEPPFDRGKLRRAGLGELARVLAQTDPPRPSTRTATSLGAGIAERRGLDPPALRRRLRGDLDRVALRCLESDRERRYSSILDLAADLERHLRHEPVTARPPTVRYRVSKFVRRNRPFVVSSVAIAAILVAATTVSLREAQRAREHERIAERRRVAASHEAYRSSLSAAMLAAQLGQVRAARDLLAGIDPEFHGFEWRHVSSAIDSSVARIEGERWFRAAALAEDGDTLTTVNPYGLVQRWSVSEGTCIDSIELGFVSSGPLDFDRDASHLAVVLGRGRNSISLYDLRTGERVAELAAEFARIEELALHPDGDAVAYGGADEARLARFDGSPAVKIHGLRTSHLDFSTDGSLLAHAFNLPNETMGPGWAVLLDGRTGKVVHPSKRPGSVRIDAAALDPRGNRLAYGMDDKSVWIYDREVGKFVRRLRGHLSGISAVAWSPTGDRLASGSSDATIRVWDPANGALLAVLTGPTLPIQSLTFSADGARLVARAGGEVWIWEHPEGTPSSVLLGHHAYVYGVAFVGGGERLVSGGWDSRLRAWNPATGEALGTVAADGLVRGLRASRDGRVVVSADDFRVRIRDPDLLQVRAELPAYSAGVLAIDLDAAGKRLAVRTPLALEVWSLDPPTLLRKVGVTTAPFAGVALSPDGRLAVTSISAKHEPAPLDGAKTIGMVALDGGDILLVDVESGASSRFTESAGEISSLAFSPDGRWLACGGMKGTVLLRDGRSGEPVSRLEGHKESIFALAFSPDGRCLASGSDDTTIRLWDPEHGSAVAVLTGHEEYVYALAFSPDGSRLASGSGDGTVRMWDTRPERERRLARQAAARARADARPGTEARIAELGSAAAALRSYAAEPASPARTASIEAVILHAIGGEPAKE